MPSVNVELSELFEAISDEELVAEMRKRAITIENDECCCESEDDLLSNRRETHHLLKSCANFLRDHNNPSMGLQVDDLISELGLV